MAISNDTIALMAATLASSAHIDATDCVRFARDIAAEVERTSPEPEELSAFGRPTVFDIQLWTRAARGDFDLPIKPAEGTEASSPAQYYASRLVKVSHECANCCFPKDEHIEMAGGLQCPLLGGTAPPCYFEAKSPAPFEPYRRL